MFGLIKKMFMGLLISIVNAYNHTKCVLLSNQKCITQSTLINLHPNEYSHEFRCYPFAVKLDRCVRRCNTLNDLYNKVCVQNKTEDLNLSVFNVITGINESKTLPKHMSCKCKCKFERRKRNLDRWWNSDKCQCECKNRHVCEKDYIWNPATCSCDNGKCLVSIVDDSAITCDETIVLSNEETNL